MKPIRIGTAALNQTPLDWEGNLRRIVQTIDAAAEADVGLLLLPELCTTGYGCEDAFFGADVTDRAWAMLMEIVERTEGMVVSVGLPIRRRGGLYNSACLIANGAIAGFTAKEHLAGDGLHYEPRWFKSWPNHKIVELERNGRRYPFGDVFFDLDGIRVGYEICEDAWVAQRRGALDGHAMDILLNPSASHFAFGKRDVRERIVLEGSRSMAVTYVYANLLGNEAGRVIYDGQCLIAQNGELLARTKRLTFAEFELATAVVDIEASRTTQAQTASFQPDISDPGSKRVNVDFALPEVVMTQPELDVAAWEESGHIKEEEFARAITLGLFDYMTKSRSKGFVLSLSGGADSAAVACLVSMMARRALRDLGQDALCERTGVSPQGDANAWVKHLLCTVYQRTDNSSKTTHDAAEAVASAIGAEFFVLDVQGVVDAYTKMVEGALEQELTWDDHDLPLQNIQARARAPSVWMLANIRRALLLATSNRSEAAVGYATMDGDTAGGLSPIAGIDKAFLRHWLVWLESEGPLGLGPVPELKAVNAQQPTAELRPPDKAQTDEGDLMPYPVLDFIEDLAIGDKRSPADCLQLLQSEFSQYDRATLVAWVKRFFTLWSRNQWKRERYAPAFHVDDKSLDPKTWCRYPILSGGFTTELAELDLQD